MLERFQSWLSKNRSFIFSWYTKDSIETQEPERSLVELPPALRKKLVNASQTLPSNPADKKAIQANLEEIFERWRDNPSNSNNSLVILSSPVNPVSRILSESLEEWAEQKQILIRLLPWTKRPTCVETIKSKLQHYLEQEPICKKNLESERYEVVIIPNLSWCFLRSLEGLEGIEYLQSLLCDGSKNRFWVIGAGQVAWEYLNSVCNLRAYCGEVFALPEIDPEQLESWFEPIVEELEIVFDQPTIDKQLLDGDKDNKTNYFDRLASISDGVSTVAVQGFLKSIRYEKPEENEAEKEREDQQRSTHRDVIVAQTPKLPDLPALESADRYLLYSLLLHGDLTMSALAESLGDTRSEVQALVQLLRRKGMVEQQDDVLKINPIYYPKLKQELANNNFIINEE